MATHENIWLLRLKRPGCQPFKLEMVGSIPPGATQFIGSESLTIWEEDKATSQEYPRSGAGKTEKTLLML